MEALDLALGLGVVLVGRSCGVTPRAASSCSRALAGDDGSQPGGEHQAVVGQGGGRGAVRGARGAERGHDVRLVTGVWAVSDRTYREWSSIQARISASRPPASGWWVKSDCHSSFGCSAGEPGPRRPGPLAGLRGHQPGPGPGTGAPSPGRPSAGDGPAGARRSCAGPRPAPPRRAPSAAGRSARRRRGRSRTVTRLAARPRLERRLPLQAVPGQQLVDPGPGHPVLAGDLPDRALLDNDGGDYQAGLRHPRSVWPRPPPAARDTPDLSSTS